MFTRIGNVLTISLSTLAMVLRISKLGNCYSQLSRKERLSSFLGFEGEVIGGVQDYFRVAPAAAISLIGTQTPI